MRRAGYSLPYVANDGTVYANPGGGYSLDGSSAEVVRRAQIISGNVSYIRQQVHEQADEIAEYILSESGRKLDKLVLRLNIGPTSFSVLEEQSGLVIPIESNSGK